MADSKLSLHIGVVNTLSSQGLADVSSSSSLTSFKVIEVSGTKSQVVGGGSVFQPGAPVNTLSQYSASGKDKMDVETNDWLHTYQGKPVDWKAV